VQKLVSEAHARFKSNTEELNSQVYPALARTPSDLFGAVDGWTNPMVNAIAGASIDTTVIPKCPYPANSSAVC